MSDFGFNEEVAMAKGLRQLFLNLAIESVPKNYDLNNQDTVKAYLKECLKSKEIWMQSWRNIMKNNFTPRCCKWLDVK